jgi:nitrate reductase cytochrome c-type subunit
MAVVLRTWNGEETLSRLNASTYYSQKNEKKKNSKRRKSLNPCNQFSPTEKQMNASREHNYPDYPVRIPRRHHNYFISSNALKIDLCF